MTIDQIDVVMPTKESAGVLGRTLDTLANSKDHADIEIARLVVIDDQSEDNTREIAREKAAEYGWELDLVAKSLSLPLAREVGIKRVQSEWFLFLDDDVRLAETYLREQMRTIAPAIGAIQGRKAGRDGENTDWVRRRARRGGTHATLIRHKAVVGVSFPDDLHVLEDEYLRRRVEDRGYLWVFHHGARFEHINVGRHPIGWQEGYLAGKYGLKPFSELALNVPFAVLTGRNPLPHLKRAAGWMGGCLEQTIKKNGRSYGWEKLR